MTRPAVIIFPMPFNQRHRYSYAMSVLILLTTCFRPSLPPCNYPASPWTFAVSSLRIIIYCIPPWWVGGVKTNYCYGQFDISRIFYPRTPPPVTPTWGSVCVRYFLCSNDSHMNPSIPHSLHASMSVFLPQSLPPSLAPSGQPALPWIFAV